MMAVKVFAADHMVIRAIANVIPAASRVKKGEIKMGHDHPDEEAPFWDEGSEEDAVQLPERPPEPPDDGGNGTSPPGSEPQVDTEPEESDA